MNTLRTAGNNMPLSLTGVYRQAASAAFLLLCGTALHAAAPNAPVSGCPGIWQKTLPRLQDDAPQDLCQYRGKVALVVNTASYCGFTSQYEGLERVYARFQGQGFTVLGFPSNDFGQQEPGNSQQIADFCFNTYGVKFPMFAKSNVAGAAANPLFKELAQASGSAPRWNFHKYVISRQGKVIAHFGSDTVPEDPRLLASIQKALKAP